jgi:hypothetical protein
MSACAHNQNLIWSLVQISAKNQTNKQKLSVDVQLTNNKISPKVIQFRTAQK